MLPCAACDRKEWGPTACVFSNRDAHDNSLFYNEAFRPFREAARFNFLRDVALTAYGRERLEAFNLFATADSWSYKNTVTHTHWVRGCLVCTLCARRGVCVRRVDDLLKCDRRAARLTFNRYECL
jgi:hypothetical protein